MLRRKWLAADLLTGNVIAYLPSITADQPLRRVLGQYETAEVVLNVTAGIDPNWERAILPWGSVLIAYRGAPGSEVIEWGGIVNQEVRQLGTQVRLPLVTVEAFTDRCYVGDYTTDPTNTGASRDQNLIGQDLINLFGAANGGLPITVIVVGAPGTPRARTYLDTSDTTLYTTLEELMDVSGGVEFTGHWQWIHQDPLPPRIVPVFYLGTRIGQAAVGGQARCSFTSRLLLPDTTLTNDWSARSAANDVLGTVGTGPGRATARAVAADFGGRPRLQCRYSPATAIADQAALQQNVNGMLATMQNGSQAIQLVAPYKNGILFGTDWDIGDDIGWKLTGPTYPTLTAGITRAIGVESTDTSVTPIIAGGS